jgi:hypothetical protein
MVFRWLKRRREVPQAVLDAHIKRCLEVFSRDKRSEDDIVQDLIVSGVSAVEAEKLVALVPLAFGRILIAHMGSANFSQSAILETARGLPRPVDLRREPIFMRALKLAGTMFHEGPRELFAPTATSSAEVDCVNKLLHGGSRIEDLVFTEPRFLRLTYEQWVEDR